MGLIYCGAGEGVLNDILSPLPFFLVIVLSPTIELSSSSDEDSSSPELDSSSPLDDYTAAAFLTGAFLGGDASSSDELSSSPDEESSYLAAAFFEETPFLA